METEGITVANNQGWITAPAPVYGLSDTVTAGSTTCNKQPGSAIGPVQTQMGSGSDDGAYIHNSVYYGGFAGFTNPSTVNFNNPFPEGVFWADIDVSKPIGQKDSVGRLLILLPGV